MLFPISILAETEPIAKFLGVAIVMVIWIVGMIAQSLKKQQQQKQQRRPVDLAEAIRQRMPANRPQKAKLPKVRQPPRQAKRPNWGEIASQVIVPPPVVPRAPAEERIPAAAKEAPPPPTERPVKKTPFVDAKALNRWLKPSTLQQQFILTELFAKPKCLRD